MRILLLLLLLLYHKQIRNIIQDKANAHIYMLLRVTEEKKIKILLIFFYYASYCNKVYIYIQFMANFKKFSLVPIKTL